MTPQEYKFEVTQELENILDYWKKYTIDNEFGGFYGQINDRDEVVLKAEKGLVLNARILWTFSAAYGKNPKLEYIEIAHRAYQYLRDFFRDKINGGLYWSVNYQGFPLNTRKQIYGQAFAIYGLSEYYKITQNNDALDWAIELFEIIEKNSLDTIYGGYLEALAENWQPIQDLKLSEKDANEKKSMNTHLHILEAYSNLKSVYENEHLNNSLEQILNVFLKHIINAKTGHQALFFDDDWSIKSDIISYGHDIEASWLLYEAAERISNEQIIKKVHELAIKMTDSVQIGLSQDGGLAYESEGEHHDADKHWWVQAEAMVGYLNTYQLSKNDKYLKQSIKSWEFIKKFLITSSGEWFWATQGTENIPMPNQDKAGFWKCPYHNARACMEVIERL
ncbi:AGE family epimerase/isomerase [Arcicella sp. LKC2W]|uniref:AGE family epimerase/isomerase n=1 Tax=Arcicella sp. LKC2W TaxID=2984198 RepID=UPI002B20C9A9|nr:AGE family epimerase/isomerase [Arcicella sp. LKC2W]MEA5461091.1 AGE family epimerase/isomerase [Arcicella sp. LKC2W]